MNRIYVTTNDQIKDLIEYLKKEGIEELPGNIQFFNNNRRRYIHIYNNKFSGWCEERSNNYCKYGCLRNSTFEECVESHNVEIKYFANRETKLKRILQCTK